MGNSSSQPKKPPQVHAAVIFRHGARSPTDSTLKTFAGTEIGEVWEGEESGKLTTIGSKQSENLGAHLAAEMFEKAKSQETAEFKEIAWYSSVSERALASGHSFMESFKQKIKELDSSFNGSNLVNPMEIANADEVFRPWFNNKKYKGLTREVQAGGDVTFEQKAEKEREFLGRMRKYMSDECANKSWSDALYRMGHFYEMMHCEKFWHDDSKVVLSNLLSESDKLKIRELAIWVWDYRFFRLKMSRTIGIQLRDWILKDSRSCLSFYSAHDYTILSLLSSLKAKGYPEDPLDFSSYMILYIDPSKKKVKRIELNAMPYSEESKTIVTGQLKAIFL